MPICSPRCTCFIIQLPCHYPQRRKSEGTDSDSALVIQAHQLSCETEKEGNEKAVNNLTVYFRKLEKEEQSKRDTAGMEINKSKDLNGNKGKEE